MEKLKQIYKQHEEIIVYIIVGVLTTIVSWLACFVAKFFLNPDNDIQNTIINAIGWVVGVCFAYPLNRTWVFKSTNKNILKEFGGFATSRISTGLLDILIMWLVVNVWSLKGIIVFVCGWFDYIPTDASLSSLNYWIAKIFISSVLVTIINYVISKVLVFGKKKN